jgi:hypothetical protein
VREAVSRDLRRAIKIGRGRSDQGGERLWAVPLLSAAVKLPELGRVRATAVPGSPELVREGEADSTNSMTGLWPRVRVQRGVMAGKSPWACRRNSGEGFRPRGEGLRHAKTWDSFSRATGNSRTDAGALGRIKLASHREGAADRHGRHRRRRDGPPRLTPAKPKLAGDKA